MQEKKNCYSCKHRGSVIGSCHSSCNVLKDAGESLGFGKTGDLLGIAVAAGMYELVDDKGEQIVKLDPHGVKNGWANWPINFDPTWVIECPFYTQKDAQ